MKSMMMKTWLVTLGTGAVVLLAGAANGANGDGKAIFTANKCSGCHSVSSAGITAANAGSKAPDLAGINKKSEWIQGVLKQTEMLNGKKHMIKFKGSDDDLKTLAGWISSQKKK